MLQNPLFFKKSVIVLFCVTYTHNITHCSVNFVFISINDG